MVEAGRDMQLIGARQPPEHQFTRDVSAGKRRCTRTEVGGETQEQRDNSRHAQRDGGDAVVMDNHVPRMYLPPDGLRGATPILAFAAVTRMLFP